MSGSIKGLAQVLRAGKLESMKNGMNNLTVKYYAEIMYMFRGAALPTYHNIFQNLLERKITFG